MSYGYPSPRRFPRSLREAWPREHGSAIEHFARPGLGLRRIGCCIAAAIVIGACIALGA